MAFKGNSKQIKKWARKYDILLVSDEISRKVTKLIGRHIAKVGKVPINIGEN